MTTHLKIITNSSLTCFQTCPLKYKYRYVLGVRPRASSQALTFGTLVHKFLDSGMNNADEILEQLSETPGWVRDDDDLHEWQSDRIKIAVLIQEAAKHLPKHEIVATEKSYEIAWTDEWKHSGKIDAVVRVGDGRTMVREYKTASCDISPGSDYWIRLRRDTQIAGYLCGARELGYEVSGVVYTVIGKPKHVINRNKKETPVAFRDRVTEMVREEPSKFFGEQVIPVDDRSWVRTVDAAIGGIGMCEATDYWPAHSQACLGRSRCEYLDVCHAGIDPNHPPHGMERVADQHPELKETT